jgi:hypothetical protein
MSEVAKLMLQIELEYEAAQSGSAPHPGANELHPYINQLRCLEHPLSSQQ